MVATSTCDKAHPNYRGHTKFSQPTLILSCHVRWCQVSSYYLNNYKIQFVLTFASVISETASRIVTYDIPPDSAWSVEGQSLINTGLWKARGLIKAKIVFALLPQAELGRTGQQIWAGCLKECAAAAVSLFSYCTHTLSAAVQNRDEKTRMREDMNCYLFLPTEKPNACFLK